MSDNEKRARELLAAEFNLDGREQFERGELVVVTTASALNAIIAALTPPKIAGGNLIDDPLYRGLDALYDRAWTDCHQKRKFDPRGCREWEAVANLVRSALTPPEGYVPATAILVTATRLRRLASAASPLGRKAYIKAAEDIEMTVSAARTEVKP